MSNIRVSKSCIGEAEKKAVMKVLEREFLGMGEEVKAFEEELSYFFGRPAVCVVNGTAALHLALQAADIGPGDEVLVQSLTYVASFQAISATGALPIACDVDPTTVCIDLNDAKTRVTPRTKAIMPVHYAGGVGDLDGIYEFAKEHNLRVIEDAAHAFGTTYKDAVIGGFGDISCFSFDGIKNITSGEGGCIVTNDSIILQKIRDARLLGVEQDTEKRFSGKRSWDPNVTAQGWRYHMSDIMAAIGREQLANFAHFKSKRQELAKRYVELLKPVSLISIFEHNYDLVVPHIFVIKLNDGKKKEKLIEYLLENGISVGIHYKPNHLLTYYDHGDKSVLPNAENLYPKLLTLPLHPEICDKDVDYIVSVLVKGLRYVR